MTITPMGEVYPETGTFPPPYRNSDNDVKEINVKLERIIKLLEAILNNVQNHIKVKNTSS